MRTIIAAIDQGTTSSRCVLFAEDGSTFVAQKEHAQIYPRAGWVEHDPMEIWQRVQEVIAAASSKADVKPGEISAIGITNQRETTVVWDKRTGLPLCNAIVWQDTRTKELCDVLAKEGGGDRFRAKTGLPLATYFSGPKLKWLLDNVPGLRQQAEAGNAIFGTIDSWLIYNLTGGKNGGRHVSDPTNASRTMLLDLKTLQWDEQLLALFGIPRKMMPEIVPSGSKSGFGKTRADGVFAAEIPIAGVLGDQHAALVGQGCLSPGAMKNTYGTGCFMLLHTGHEAVASKHGLVTTVAYQFEGETPCYALEGSVAVAGALVQWLRDNLKIIAAAPEIETLARSVEDNGGVYFVPALSGLFAPYWRSDARGTIVGLSQHSTRAQIARAALEATAFQTLDVLDAMQKDAAVKPRMLKVDGGMTANDLLMQFQADLLGLPVTRPRFAETTVLGAAATAGRAMGMPDFFLSLSQAGKSWQPAMVNGQRDQLRANWKKAIERSLNWIE